MAQRRMFSPDIVCSEEFLSMPISSQALYFQLGMRADDDGFVQPTIAMRLAGSTNDDLKVLLAKRFILPFESGVVVIKHWLIHNMIRADRYKPTRFQEEKNRLFIKQNNAYTDNEESGTPLLATKWQPNGNPSAPQVRLGKVSKQHTASRDLSTPLTGKEQATKLKSKHMSKFRAYDENNPPEEASIDADSGELKSNSTKGRNLEAQRVAQYFAKKAREYTGKPYINTGYAHVKKIMENNGISELDMTSIIDNWFADLPNEVIAINIYKALSPFAINKFLQEK